MPIEAPISKFKKNGLILWAVVCIGVAIYCAYDGYFNEKFKTKHTNEDGTPDGTLVFNQKAPPYFIGAAVLLGAYFFIIRNKKMIADENELIISDKERIPYDSIQTIDKTHFRLESKTQRQFTGDSEGKLKETQETETDSAWHGYFIITYKDKNGREVNRKISDRKYDNLKPVLDHLVAKITLK